MKILDSKANVSIMLLSFINIHNVRQMITFLLGGCNVASDMYLTSNGGTIYNALYSGLEAFICDSSKCISI